MYFNTTEKCRTLRDLLPTDKGNILLYLRECIVAGHGTLLLPVLKRSNGLTACLTATKVEVSGQTVDSAYDISIPYRTVGWNV